MPFDEGMEVGTGLGAEAKVGAEVLAGTVTGVLAGAGIGVVCRPKTSGAGVG